MKTFLQRTTKYLDTPVYCGNVTSLQNFIGTTTTGNSLFIRGLHKGLSTFTSSSRTVRHCPHLIVCKHFSVVVLVRKNVILTCVSIITRRSQSIRHSSVRCQVRRPFVETNLPPCLYGDTHSTDVNGTKQSLLCYGERDEESYRVKVEGPT